MSLTTPDRIRTLQRKLYAKAKQEPACRFYTLYDKNADLSKYFDSIPHAKLMTVVAERIVDGCFHFRNSSQVISKVRQHAEDRLRTHLMKRHKVKYRKAVHLMPLAERRGNYIK